MTYQELLQQTKQQLLSANKEERVAELLLMHVSDLDNATLYAQLKETMPDDQLEEFNRLLIKHIDEDVPLQHLTRDDVFFGFRFYVNKDVLIPRFETEELVAKVLAYYDEFFEGDVDVVDLGTGSGAIAISLVMEEPHMNMTATDVSSAAIAVANTNADLYDVDIRFLKGSWCEPLIRRYDIVVTNPPYIPDNEELPEMISKHEPHLALFGGPDGLDHYRSIFACLPNVLKPKFFVALEHGKDHKDAIDQLAKAAFPTAKVWCEKDMQGKDRFTFVYQA